METFLIRRNIAWGAGAEPVVDIFNIHDPSVAEVRHNRETLGALWPEEMTTYTLSEAITVANHVATKWRDKLLKIDDGINPEDEFLVRIIEGTGVTLPI